MGSGEWVMGWGEGESVNIFILFIFSDSLFLVFEMGQLNYERFKFYDENIGNPSFLTKSIILHSSRNILINMKQTNFVSPKSDSQNDIHRAHNVVV